MLSESDAVLVEELRVSHEELQVQAEELAEAHHVVATERETYLSLFEHAPVPYFVTDAAGSIRMANRAASTLLRCRTDRLRHKPLASFVPQSGRQQFRQQLARVARTGEPSAVLLRLQPRTGAERVMTGTVAAAASLVGEVVELRWLLSPATPGVQVSASPQFQQENESLKRSVRELTELVAWASHELRTPATSIGGYADILALGVRGMLTPDQQAMLVRIQQAQAHLVALLDDLMTFTRAGSGSLHFESTDTPVDRVLDQVLALIEPQCAARDIRMSARGCGGLHVVADAERMLQIVLNLVTNAVKFTPIGGTVDLACDPEGDTVVITVRDSGPGVPEEARERVFRPYVRLENAVQPRIQGAGLGLAISRTFARAMGGDLTCTDARDGGSAFVLRLPRSTGFAPRIDANA
jgi:PAS domain S-box-containing protein